MIPDNEEQDCHRLVFCRDHQAFIEQVRVDGTPSKADGDIMDLPHKSDVSFLKLVSDEANDEDDVVHDDILLAGCDNGFVYLWDCGGHDSGELLTELRSLTPQEIIIPIGIMVVNFFQINCFAFGNAVRWHHHVKHCADVVVHLTAFHWEFFLRIRLEDIFWPRSIAILSSMLTFLIFAWLDVPRRISALVTRLQSSDMFKADMKQRRRIPGFRGWWNMLYLFGNAMSQGTYIFVKTMATILVVPIAKSCAKSIDCPLVNGTRYVRNMNVQCYVDSHWKLLIVTIVTFVLYFSLLVPYAVVNGDARYVQPRELLSMTDWRVNSLRRGKVLNLGPVHPRVRHVYGNAIMELFVKVGIPVIQVLLHDHPLVLMAVTTAIVALWLLHTFLYPPLVMRKYNMVVVGSRVHILLTMLCATYASWLHDRNRIEPPIALLAVTVVVPVVTLIAIRVKEEEEAEANDSEHRTPSLLRAGTYTDGTASHNLSQIMEMHDVR